MIALGFADQFRDQAFLVRTLDEKQRRALSLRRIGQASLQRLRQGPILEFPAIGPSPDDGVPQGFVLSASRLDLAKRIDLLLDAAALEDGFDVVIASDGPDRDRLEEVARARGLDGRVRFEGRVSPERLAELYATCTAVFYAPLDEDFGMGPYEAFLSAKPVITTTDAGGPLDVVHDRRTGLVVAPEPAAIGRAASWLREHEREAADFGRAGKTLADEVTWDRAIARLLS